MFRFQRKTILPSPNAIFWREIILIRLIWFFLLVGYSWFLWLTLNNCTVNGCVRTHVPVWVFIKILAFDILKIFSPSCVTDEYSCIKQIHECISFTLWINSSSLIALLLNTERIFCCAIWRLSDCRVRLLSFFDTCPEQSLLSSSRILSALFQKFCLWWQIFPW